MHQNQTQHQANKRNDEAEGDREHKPQHFFFSHKKIINLQAHGVRGVRAQYSDGEPKWY